MIWILLILGLLLVVFNIKALKKENNSFNDIFQNAEENMSDFEFKLGEIRREFSETILELQKEIEALKANSNTVDNTAVSENPPNDEDDNISESQEEQKAQLSETNIISENSVKVDEINKLLLKGVSIEEISAKLGIGKGEILLIKELYLK